MKARWVRRNWRPTSLPRPPYSSASNATCTTVHDRALELGCDAAPLVPLAKHEGGLAIRSVSRVSELEANEKVKTGAKMRSGRHREDWGCEQGQDFVMV